VAANEPLVKVAILIRKLTFIK